jgi:hypothetical protein
MRFHWQISITSSSLTSRRLLVFAMSLKPIETRGHRPSSAVPGVVTIAPAADNREHRLDARWYAIEIDGSPAVTMYDWERYCRERGLELRMASSDQESFDPFTNAKTAADRLFWKIFGARALPSAGRRDPRPLSSVDRLRDDIYTALTIAGPWPTQLSTLDGALAILYQATRQHPLTERQRAEGIAAGLTLFLGDGGTSPLSGDECHACGAWMVRRTYDTATIARMIENGFAAWCDTCAVSLGGG